MNDQKLLTDGTLIIHTDVDIKDVDRVILDQKGTKFCSIFYRDAGEIMRESIGRQSAIDAVNKIAPVNTEYDCILLDRLDVIYMLTELPSAEPEVIRCKDCKHWMPYDWMFSEVWQSKNMEDYPEDEMGCDCCDMNMRADDYCSRAERKEE